MRTRLNVHNFCLNRSLLGEADITGVWDKELDVYKRQIVDILLLEVAIGLFLLVHFLKRKSMKIADSHCHISKSEHQSCICLLYTSS